MSQEIKRLQTLELALLALAEKHIRNHELSDRYAMEAHEVNLRISRLQKQS